MLSSGIPTKARCGKVGILKEVTGLGVVLPRGQLSRVTVALNLDRCCHLRRVMTLYRGSKMRAGFVPSCGGVVPAGPCARSVLKLPIVGVHCMPLGGAFGTLIGQTVSVTKSVIKVVMASPLVLLVYIVVGLASPKPLVCGRREIKLRGRAFQVCGFHSVRMRPRSRRGGT